MIFTESQFVTLYKELKYASFHLSTSAASAGSAMDSISV